MSMSLALGSIYSDYTSLIQGIRHLREWAKPGSKNEFGNYQDWAQTVKLSDRQTLVNKIANKIALGELVPRTLLVVIAGESHGAIIQLACSTYLKSVPCDVSDEFGAARDIMELVQENRAQNRGAVLAALVGLGDRRIHGCMRVLRRSLNTDEVRQFSRCVPPLMKANHIEFCLEWLIQAYHEKAPRSMITSLTCSLMLVVVKDDSGIVEDADAGVGFTVPGDVVSISRSALASDIVRRLHALKEGRDVDYEIDKVIHMWENVHNWKNVNRPAVVTA